ncbi:YqfO family protein [Patescibacteria group bacterium]|nr:YqfO family protein [Patescibacteria group bacterium]MBU1703717.1 YqfO family protein [Patescibacteria group bacterium]MBU1953540.1 YqfO family protein [Patescibacteria group bacterium]
MEFSFVRIFVFVPPSHADAVRDALAKAGAGKIGNYDSCSFSVGGIGRFRPLEGADPFVGTVGELEEVPEERIETVCPTEKLEEVLAAVRAVHPYEEPAIDVYPLLNLP